jgi:hypothetical protein
MPFNEEGWSNLEDDVKKNWVGGSEIIDICAAKAELTGDSLPMNV